jgi:membrane protease YdiL (CAAX protease family)
MRPVALLFLFYCIHRCLLAPVVVAVWTRTKGHVAPPMVRNSYVSTVTRSTLFALIALLTAFLEQIPVFGSIRLNLKTVLLAGAFLLLNLAYDRLEWAYTPIGQRQRIWRFLPHTPKEKACWLLVSTVVGVCEEMVFRGVLFGVFSQATGGFWMATFASAAFFALYHLPSGWLGIASLFGVAVGLQWFVQLSGGLYVAIAIHFGHNMVNGIVYGAKESPISGMEREGTQAAEASHAIAAAQQHPSVSQSQVPTPIADPAER